MKISLKVVPHISFITFFSFLFIISSEKTYDDIFQLIVNTIIFSRMGDPCIMLFMYRPTGRVTHFFEQLLFFGWR